MRIGRGGTMGLRIRRRGMALLVAGLLAAAPAAVIAQQDESAPAPNPGWIAGKIQELLSGPGRTVRIGGIDTSWRLDVALRDLTIADEQGVWLTVDRAALDWTPTALLRRDFRITGLTVDTMTVERLPKGEEEPPPSDEPFSLPRLPDLPVGLDLQNLTVQ